MGEIKMEISKPKKYACLSKELQAAYERLPERQRLYADFRAMGHSKATSAVMAGYQSKKPNQMGYIMERKTPYLGEICDILSKDQMSKQIIKEQQDRIDRQNEANNAAKRAKEEQDWLNGKDKDEILPVPKEMDDRLSIIKGNSDVETIRRINFYRNIASGRIKTVKKVSRYNGSGTLLETKIEEVDSVDARIQARKELDRILGLNAVIDIGKINAGGDITINIVDASKKDAIEDPRNAIELDIDSVEVIDGKEVLVAKEVKETANGK